MSTINTYNNTRYAMPNKIPLTLEDLLKPKVRVKRQSSEVLKSLSEPTVAVGIYKIPESEKPFSVYFAKAVVEHKVNVKPKTWKESLFCITAMLSKYPHYIYVQSCKVVGHPKTYWFKDTSRDVTIILTESEITRKIKF